MRLRRQTQISVERALRLGQIVDIVGATGDLLGGGIVRRRFMQTPQLARRCNNVELVHATALSSRWPTARKGGGVNKLDVIAPAGKLGRLHESTPHDSAAKQVAGRADYVDDLTEPEGTLHAYLGL